MQEPYSLMRTAQSFFSGFLPQGSSTLSDADAYSDMSPQPSQRQVASAHAAALTVHYAILIQRLFRGFMIRRERRFIQRQERMLAVMYILETDKAIQVQRAWRAKRERTLEQELNQSVIRLQSFHRGQFTRHTTAYRMRVEKFSRVKAARSIQRFYIRRIVRTAAMRSCCGRLEKRRSTMPFFGMEMVFWQGVWTFVNGEALCYQRIGRDGEPKPATTKQVLFAEVSEVCARLDECVLVLDCSKPSEPSANGRSRWFARRGVRGGQLEGSRRQTYEHQFLLPSAEACERWASNLVSLIRWTSHDVLAFVERTDQDEHVELAADAIHQDSATYLQVGKSRER